MNKMMFHFDNKIISSVVPRDEKTFFSQIGQFQEIWYQINQVQKEGVPFFPVCGMRMRTINKQSKSQVNQHISFFLFSFFFSFFKICSDPDIISLIFIFNNALACLFPFSDARSRSCRPFFPINFHAFPVKVAQAKVFRCSSVGIMVYKVAQKFMRTSKF